MTGRLAISRGWRAELVAALLACICAGCGRNSDRARVTGTLLHYDGTPLVGANVIATDGDTGKSAQATTNGQGHFDIGTAEQGDGIPPGNYEIVIIEDRGDPDNRRPPTIAAKYRDRAKSGISVSLKAGDTKELSLKLDPR